MDDQRREEAPSEIAQAWDSVRRVREPVAWTLLVITATSLAISTCQLFGLASVPVPAPAPTIGPSGPVSAVTFAVRASVVAPQFVPAGIIALPVLSVILVAFASGPTDRARQVAQAAISIQAIGLALGVLSWLGAAGANLRPGVWFIYDALDLAIAAAGLIFIAAVRRSQALRSPMPQLQDSGEDDEDFGEGDEDFGEED